jgi:hypothetical protein
MPTSSAFPALHRAWATGAVGGARLVDGPRMPVGVRVSRTDQAMTQPGDPQVFSEPVPIGTGGLKIEVKDIVP